MRLSAEVSLFVVDRHPGHNRYHSGPLMKSARVGSCSQAHFGHVITSTISYILSRTPVPAKTVRAVRPTLSARDAPRSAFRSSASRSSPVKATL